MPTRIMAGTQKKTALDAKLRLIPREPPDIFLSLIRQFLNDIAQKGVHE